METSTVYLPSGPINLNFADGVQNKRVYLTGFEAGINLVMEYWTSGTDKNSAVDNLEKIKDLMIEKMKDSDKKPAVKKPR